MKYVWFNSPLNINFNNQEHKGFMNWSKNLTMNITTEQREMFIHIIDNIWFARNKAYHDNVDIHALGAVMNV